MSLTIKICGLTTIDDARAAAQFGAHFLGFVLAPSPRMVSVEQCCSIINALRQEHCHDRVKMVGVVVNESRQRMHQILASTPLDYLQLHGDESCDDAVALGASCYKALRINEMSVANEAGFTAMVRQWPGEHILVDTFVAGTYGGTGITLDVKTARSACAMIRSVGKKCFVAGGITADNVAGIIAAVNPDGIDVSSGIEESKGKKSLAKMEKLFLSIPSGNKGI